MTFKSETLGEHINFSNGKTSPARSDHGKYLVFGSNGEIGRSDQTNAPAQTTIIGRVGSYCGSVHYSSEPCWVTDNAIKATAKIPEDGRFWYFALANQNLHELRAGSGQPLINQTSLKAVELPVPSKRARQKIGALLGALDDKIELNRQMNETLEAMARAIFKDWFVDFGPTRRKMAGETDSVKIMGGAFPPEKSTELAPLFPATLGDNGLPEGWVYRPLDDIGDFLNGLALQKFPAQGGKLNLPVIKIAELRNGVTTNSNRASTDVPEKYVIENGDFIFSWSGSLMAKFWTGGAGALNQHLFKVTSESHPMWFVSEWVQTHLEEFQRIAASKAVTMGHIKRSHLAEAKCVCPPDHALSKLGEVFGPLITKQIPNEEESQTLAQMRDLLLPKLMSGEIRLKDMGDEG